MHVHEGLERETHTDTHTRTEREREIGQMVTGTHVSHNGFCKTLVKDSGLEHPRVGSVRGGRCGLLLLPWLPSPWIPITSGVVCLDATLCKHQFDNQSA